MYRGRRSSMMWNSPSEAENRPTFLSPAWHAAAWVTVMQVEELRLFFLITSVNMSPLDPSSGFDLPPSPWPCSPDCTPLDELQNSLLARSDGLRAGGEKNTGEEAIPHSTGRALIARTLAGKAFLCGFGAETAVHDNTCLRRRQIDQFNIALDGRDYASLGEMVAGGNARPGPQARGCVPEEPPLGQLQHSLGEHRHSSWTGGLLLMDSSSGYRSTMQPCCQPRQYRTSICSRMSCTETAPSARFLPVSQVNPLHLCLWVCPQDELYRRMFCLPPPTSPLAVILPSAAQFRVVATDEAVLQLRQKAAEMQASGQSAAGQVVVFDSMADREVEQEGDLMNAISCGSGSSGPSTGKAVHLKGFSSVEEFLATRGGTAVKWFLEDSAQLWQAARQLGLDEAADMQEAEATSPSQLPTTVSATGAVAAASSQLTRLRRRFLFKPCPLLEQQVGAMERELAARRCSGSRSSGTSSRSNVSDGGAADPLVAEGTGAPALPQRQQRLRLRALEPGCGSGRNLAWLAAREIQVRLDDGSLVDVSWEVVGLDFWWEKPWAMSEIEIGN